MAGTSYTFFYNSQNGDRVYDADSFEHLLKRFFTSGVFSGCCQVLADGNGMSCVVGSGYANCSGKVRFFPESTSLAFANAHATYNRIDTVVIERNDTDREITCKIVQGTYAADPVPKAPVRENGIYQLVLAQVYIAAGTTGITQAMITDKRPDTSVCGYVMCAVETPDFSELYAQFETQADDVIEEYTDQFDHWYQVSTTDFQTWFDEIRWQLDEDAAGHLQNEVDTLASDFSNAYDNSDTYAVGDYCIHGNVLFKCITPIETPESWTAEHWQAVNVSDELSAERQERADETADQRNNLGIVEEGDTATKTIRAGQYVIWKGKLYTADSNIGIGDTLAASGSGKNLMEKTSGGLNDLKSVTDTLNSNFTTANTKIGHVDIRQSLIIGADASATTQTFNTYNGRKFSDYRMLVFYLFDSNSNKSNIRNCIILPQSAWTSGKQLFLLQNHGANMASVGGIMFVYDSDTTIRAVTQGSGLLTGFMIEGYMNI